MPRSTLSHRLATLGMAAVVALAVAPAALAVEPADANSVGVTIGTAPRRGTVNVGEVAARAPRAGAKRLDVPRLRPSTTRPGAAIPTPRIPIPATSSGAPAPNVPESFAGLDDFDNDPYQPCDASGCLEPGDPHIAVGPNHVLQAVNTMFRITDRSGGSAVTLTAAEFFAFGNPAFNQVADPRVIYDARHNRWLAIELSFECGTGVPNETFGFIDIAVSNTADPTGAWTSYFFSFDDVLPDYPGIGTSADKIVLSSNNFDIEGFCSGGAVPYRGAQLFAVDWAALLTLPASLPFAQTAQSTGFFTYRPAVATPARGGQNTLPVIGENSSSGAVMFRRVTGTIAAGTVAFSAAQNLTTGGPGISPFDLPPAPIQNGSPSTIADAVDERPTDALSQNNRLVFVSTYPCDLGSGNRDCVRVVELNIAPATPTLTQDLLVGEDGFDTFMGGVGLSGGGDLHVVYSKSSSGSFVNTESVYQRSTDPIGSISDAAGLAASTQNYDGTRWGDYVGVAQDPIDSAAVWQGDQHAAGGSWATRVTQMRTDGARYVPVDPVRLLDTRGGNGLTGRFSANVARTLDIAGRATIPNEAIAITGNVTVVGQTSGGFVSVTPVATNNPTTSTINFPAGDNRANNFTIPLSRAGTVGLVYRATAGKSTHLLLDVTGYFIYDNAEATYFSITPDRTLDSRNGTGVPVGKFQRGVPQSWQVEQACVDAGVTDDAVAVTGNVTVVGQTSAGFVSITPDPDPTPATSTLNFPLGDTRANGIAVQLAVDGTLSATFASTVAGAQAHIFFDLTGCFVAVSSGASWFPIEPTRRLDSRVNTGLSGRFLHGSPRSLTLAGAQFLPSTTSGVTGNLTVVNQNRGGLVSMTTSAAVPPATSTINFPIGDVRANGVFAPLASGLSRFIYMSAPGRSTDLLLDVTGYFR